MAGKRPFVLCIAGHDPSGGAGLTADVKTCEKLKAYALTVCTGITFQNDTSFVGTEWVPVAQILKQIDLLFERFQPTVAKIGLIQNATVLGEVISRLKSLNPQIKIVVDPVCKASAGFSFSREEEVEKWRTCCKDIYLLTPNKDEKELLCPELDEKDAYSAQLGCSIFLKGGHNEERPGRDYLFYESKVYPYRAASGKFHEKHGSGCVLSSAIAASLAKGLPLPKACLKAKRYIEKVLKSHPGLLGYHYE